MLKRSDSFKGNRDEKERRSNWEHELLHARKNLPGDNKLGRFEAQSTRAAADLKRPRLHVCDESSSRSSCLVHFVKL